MLMAIYLANTRYAIPKTIEIGFDFVRNLMEVADVPHFIRMISFAKCRIRGRI